jgi:hypothetical protein
MVRTVLSEVPLRSSQTLLPVLALGLLLCCGQTFAQDAAQVVHADPEWRTGGRAPQPGERIKLGTELRSSSSGDLLLNCGRQGLVSYSCRSQNCAVQACSTQSTQGVVLRTVEPQAAGISASAAQLAAYFQGLFLRQPKTPVLAVSRAGGSPNDAILLQDAKGVHWGPALARILEGRYCFRLTTLTPGRTAAARNFTINWDRDVDAEGAIAVAGLAPGSYVLEKGMTSGNSCATDPDAAPAWVLITSSANFERASADWKQGQSKLNNLEASNLGPSVVATLRHALLASIEDSLGRP